MRTSRTSQIVHVVALALAGVAAIAAYNGATMLAGSIAIAVTVVNSIGAYVAQPQEINPPA